MGARCDVSWYVITDARIVRSWLAGTAFDRWLEFELSRALAGTETRSAGLSFPPPPRRTRSGWRPLYEVETLAKFGLGAAAVAASAGGLSLASHTGPPHGPGPSTSVSTGLAGPAALANSASPGSPIRRGRSQGGLSWTRTTVAGQVAIAGPGSESGSGRPSAGSTANRSMPMPGAHALAPGSTKGAQPTQNPPKR